MPSLPRLSGREVIRALERLGFVVRRQRGSHVVLRRGSVGCVVPDHKELKTGTLNGVLKQAGVSIEDLVGALRQRLGGTHRLDRVAANEDAGIGDLALRVVHGRDQGRVAQEHRTGHVALYPMR